MLLMCANKTCTHINRTKRVRRPRYIGYVHHQNMLHLDTEQKYLGPIIIITVIGTQILQTLWSGDLTGLTLNGNSVCRVFMH